jgi:hypothetical protein
LLARYTLSNQSKSIDMRPKMLLLLLAFCGLTFASCKKSNNNDLKPVSGASPLQGDWQFQVAMRIAFGPGEIAKTDVLSFSGNRDFSIKRNGTPIQNGTYTLQQTPGGSYKVNFRSTSTFTIYMKPGASDLLYFDATAPDNYTWVLFKI